MFSQFHELSTELLGSSCLSLLGNWPRTSPTWACLSSLPGPGGAARFRFPGMPDPVSHWLVHAPVLPDSWHYGLTGDRGSEARMTPI